MTDINQAQGGDQFTIYKYQITNCIPESNIMLYDSNGSKKKKDSKRQIMEEES